MKPITHAYAGACLLAQILILLAIPFIRPIASAQQRTSDRARPEPAGWFAGDAHVHRGMLCGRDNAKTMLSPAELLSMMEPNDLDVISVLADVGNGEIRDAADDLQLITGRDHEVSTPHRLVHWDAEWHFDPKGVTFEQKALGGHLVALGLQSGHPIYDETTHPIIAWVQAQGGVVGFAHMQYLKDGIPADLDCCQPLEYPVEVALTPRVFLMEDVRGSDTAIAAYYRLLNSGFRPGLAAGTDYPCYENEPVPLGDLLTMVHIPDGQLTYRKWIDGIADGRTVVSRNGHDEFIDLKVNREAGPGDEIRLASAGSVDVEVTWTSRTAAEGSIEVVQDGAVVAAQRATVSPGSPGRLTASLKVTRSGWICARRMGEREHQSHTAAVFVTVGGRPVRASVDDPEYFVRYIDNLLEKTAENGAWGMYFRTEREAAHARYRAAKAVYERIASEARSLK
jgi:hypothetical protein